MTESLFRAAALDEIAREVAACTKCPLAKGRTNTVPGEGDPTARIMIIGEGPGYYEDKQGRPFVGPSGQLLEEMLADAGMTRQQVFITNTVKCRPPNNRDPMPEEIAACRDYLDRQEAIIQPDISITLGRYSTERYFPGEKISQVRGKPKFVRETRKVYYPLFHPAYILRNLALKNEYATLFRKLPRFLVRLDEIARDAAENPKPIVQAPAPVGEVSRLDNPATAPDTDPADTPPIVRKPRAKKAVTVDAGDMADNPQVSVGEVLAQHLDPITLDNTDPPTPKTSRPRKAKEPVADGEDGTKAKKPKSPEGVEQLSLFDL